MLDSMVPAPSGPRRPVEAVQRLKVDDGLTGPPDQRADMLVGLQRGHLAYQECVRPEHEAMEHLLAVGEPGVVEGWWLAAGSSELIEIEPEEITFPGPAVFHGERGAQRVADVQRPPALGDALPVVEVERAIGETEPVAGMHVLVQERLRASSVVGERAHQGGSK